MPTTEPDSTATPTAAEAPAATPATPRTDIYFRIRRFAPVLVVLFCIGVLVLAALVSPFKHPGPDLKLSQPLVADAGDPTAAYVVIHDGGGSDVLLSASTPAASSVVLQQWQTSMTDPEGHLVTVDHLDVPGFGDLRLQPGSDQLLLTGLTAPLTTGATIPITLQFQRSGTITVQAEAQSYDEIGRRLLPPRVQVSQETSN